MLKARERRQVWESVVVEEKRRGGDDGVGGGRGSFWGRF